MLEDIIKELKELMEYKNKYQSAKKDKQEMANYIYSNELEEYYDTSYEDRCKRYIEETCKDCRYKENCEIINEGLDEDILKPIKNADWFPSYKTCGNFKWD